MKKNKIKHTLLLAFILLSISITAQVTAPDEDTNSDLSCPSSGMFENNSTRDVDIAGAVNDGKVDDRTCYADYSESFVNGKTWGVYNITDGSNHWDAPGTLEPRIERSLPRSQTSGIGSFAKFTGTVRILEVGFTGTDADDGTYIMQAKGTHTGGGGSLDPAICLFLAKPVYDASGTNQISFDIYREQINFRGGSGSAGRDVVFLKNVLKNVETTIELKVGFRQDPVHPSRKIHYADAKIGGTSFNFVIPEAERGTQSGIRYGAYRVKGGRAQIRWANTTYQKAEVVDNRSSVAGVTYESTNAGARGTTGNSFKWNDAANWVVKGTTTNGIPTINDDVEINHKVEIGRNATGASAKSITCSNSGQLYFRENTSLTVTGNVTLARSNDAITFYAQSTGAGFKTATMIFGGNYTVGRKTVIRKRLSNGKWHLISSPFNDARVDFTTENSNTYLRDNGSVLSLASYDTANDSYTYFTNATPLTSGPRFGNGQGYSISVSNATKPDYYMTGDQHSGSVSHILSTGGNGFNLIGNPYISYVHANDAANGTTNILRENGALGSDRLVEDTIWLWDADNETWITKTRTDTDAYRINPLQGFFVKAKSTGPFTFTKAMETHDASNSTADDTFLKSSNKRFEIELSLASGKLSRKASIRYIEGTSTSFDNGYDGSMFGGYSSNLEVYTGLLDNNTGKKLAIQSLPNINFEEMVIPVGVTAEVNSEITFSANVLNLPKGHNVYLEDRLEGTLTKLDEANEEYTITVKESSVEGRFFLHTKTTSVLNVNTEVLNSIAIYKTAKKNLRIAGLKQGESTISLYNILGKKVMSTSFNTSGVQDVSLPTLAKGIYIVELQMEMGKLNKKIILE